MWCGADNPDLLQAGALLLVSYSSKTGMGALDYGLGISKTSV
jgi:hypothetical protein